jgi:predicted alpha/beta-fold hydrolase
MIPTGEEAKQAFLFTLSSGFTPRPGLTNPHAQTLVGNFQRRRNLLPPPEDRLFNVEPGAQILCHCHWHKDRREERTTLIIVHGLEGSSDSRYVIGTGSKAWRVGMNVVRMNMRNCGGTEKLTPTLYHSGMSHDVAAVVRTLIGEDRLQRIAVSGFSMGGNLVLKMVGEWGTAAPREVVAAIGISPAIDLALSADTLHTAPNRIYEWKFMKGLRARIKRKAKLFPDRYDLQYLRGVKTIREFDHEITARYSGFTGADDYYARAASSNVIDKIAIPTLVIHSKDDPFIKLTPTSRDKLEKNPHIRFVETEQGGHCAFMAKPRPPMMEDGRWAEMQLVMFAASGGKSSVGRTMADYGL